MKNDKGKQNLFSIVWHTISVCIIILSFPFTAFSREAVIEPLIYDGLRMGTNQYIIDGNGIYDGLRIGDLTIKGDIKGDGSIGDIKSFIVKGDQGTSLSYSFYPRLLYLDRKTVKKTVLEDNTNTIDDIVLEKNIKKGALIVETSYDAKKYNPVAVFTDIFSGEETLDPVYIPKAIEINNGCYYRIIVAYKVQMSYRTGNILFIPTFKKVQARNTYVYEFYLHTDEKRDDKASDNNKLYIGEKVRVENNSGYEKRKELNYNDPHFGWDLGKFVVSGYTETAGTEDNLVFLKNVGDKVMLSFRLDQDINRLNGNPSLSISEDKDGWDKNLEIGKMDFKHGALFIRKADKTGQEDKISYINFLSANATTGAETKVELFEEGDYDVSLNYQIKNTPRKVGSLEVIPEFSEYKIAFSFKIRNGNCMVFPFDIVTGSELSNYAATKNGFKLDMAKSRYLIINVKKEEYNNSTKKFDTRFNRSATDGEIYTDIGKYTFTVKNEFTKESTTKVIFVGNDNEVMVMQNASAE